MVVYSVLVFVIDLCTIEIVWQKSLGNKSMDEVILLVFPIAECHSQIPVMVMSFQYSWSQCELIRRIATYYLPRY